MQARRLISFQSSSGHRMHVLLCPTTYLTCEFVQVAIYTMQSIFVQATNAPWSNRVSAEQDAPAEWGHKKSCIAQNRENCLRATRVTWREWILSLVTRNRWRGASWVNWAVVRVVPNTWGTRNGKALGTTSSFLRSVCYIPPSHPVFQADVPGGQQRPDWLQQPPQFRNPWWEVRLKDLAAPLQVKGAYLALGVI